MIKALEQIREGVGPDGDFMIDLHQKFDFHEAVEACRLTEPLRPYAVEDPLREEQFRTQLPKLRLLTSVPISAGEEWGTRADFSSLVEQRDIDFVRVLAAERRRHHRDAEDHGDVRHAQGRPDAALHRARLARPATCTC